MKEAAEMIALLMLILVPVQCATCKNMDQIEHAVKEIKIECVCPEQVQCQEPEVTPLQNGDIFNESP